MATSNFQRMWPIPWDWKAWMNWKAPLKTISQAMTTTTPHEVRNGRQIARKPKMMSTIAHTIDLPEPRVESPAAVMFRFLLGLGIVAYSTRELVRRGRELPAPR